MKRLLSYLKHYWVYILLSLLFMLVEVYTSLLQPKLVLTIINDGILKQNINHIKSIGMSMIEETTVAFISGVMCVIFASIASRKFASDIRIDLFKKIQDSKYDKLDNTYANLFENSLNNDIDNVQNAIFILMRTLVGIPLLAIGTIYMTWTINSRLSYILAIIMTIAIIVLYFGIKRGINILYNNMQFERLTNSITASTAITATIYIITLIMNLSIAAVLWFGGIENLNGSMGIGEIVAFINYTIQIFLAFMTVGKLLVSLPIIKESVNRINRALKSEYEVAKYAGEDSKVLSHSKSDKFANKLGKRPFKIAWNYLKRHDAMPTLQIIAIVITSILSLLWPLIIGRGIDIYIISKDKKGLAIQSTFLVLLYMVISFGQRIVESKAMGLDTEDISYRLNKSITSIISCAITVFGTIAIMIHLNVKSALINIAIIPVVIFIEYMHEKGVHRYIIKKRMRLDSLNSVVSYDKFAKEIHYTNVKITNLSIRNQIYTEFIEIILHVVSNLGYMCMAVVSSLSVVKGNISVGTAIAFLLLSKYYTHPIEEFIREIEDIKSSIYNANEEFEIVNQSSDIDEIYM